MGKMKNMLCRVAGAAILTSLLPLCASAASRTVYFNASGMNRTTEGLSQAATSTCKITISNPSAQSQTVSISTTPTSINFWTSATASVAGSTATTVTGTTGCDTSCTLTAGSSATLSWSFTSYPAKPTVTASKQQIRCSGSITVSDSTAQPGFVIANGTLITFVESARMQTDATTGGTSTFGGIAVYTQVPITVNRGKPF